MAGERFGAMLRRWRMFNSWTQYTVHHWAQQAGFDAMAPSTLSVMENGKAFKPRPETFFALAEANRRVDEREFGGVRDRALLEVLQQSQPLRGDDGLVWGPAEFWSCHVGLLPVPTEYREPEAEAAEVSEVDALELSQLLTERFRSAALACGHGPIEMLRLIAGPVPRKHRSRFQAVASGLVSYSAAEVMELGGPAVLTEWIEKGVDDLEDGYSSATSRTTDS